MEPRTQYAKTSDGVNIAFWTLGEGEPFVFMLPLGHLQMEWQIPEWRDWAERLAQNRQLVRYDGRGTGMSARNVADFSLEAHVMDLEAVVDRLSLEKFALLGQVYLGPPAISYAARYPERVSSLVLWCSNLDQRPPPRLRRLAALIDQDWELFTETMAHDLIGWSQGAPAHRWAALLRASVTPETMRTLMMANYDLDVRALLPRIRSRTLILQRSEMGLETARHLAAEIPNAQLLVLEGSSLAMYLDDAESVASVIDKFLSEGTAPSMRPEPAIPPSGTAIILFADIVDSTALTERLGDAAFRAKARELDGALRAAIQEHSGTPVEGKLLGDGVLAVFTSAREAIEAALACGHAGDAAGLPLHLGIHAGDVIRERDPDGRDNVYGGAVNIASRIAGLSAAGEVLVSETVRSLARTSAGVAFEDRGEQELKGVGEAVRVWAVREDGE